MAKYPPSCQVTSFPQLSCSFVVQFSKVWTRVVVTDHSICLACMQSIVMQAQVVYQICVDDLIHAFIAFSSAYPSENVPEYTTHAHMNADLGLLYLYMHALILTGNCALKSTLRQAPRSRHTLLFQLLGLADQHVLVTKSPGHCIDPCCHLSQQLPPLAGHQDAVKGVHPSHACFQHMQPRQRQVEARLSGTESHQLLLLAETFYLHLEDRDNCIWHDHANQ